MPELSGFPFFEVHFDKRARQAEPAQATALLAHLERAGVTDLLVLAHGWNNDMAEARALYARLCKRLRFVHDFAPPQGVAGRSFAIAGVLWPSKRFAERDLIPGGAASAGGAGADASLAMQIRALRGAFDAPGANETLKRAEEVAGRLETDRAAPDEFVRLMRGLIPSRPSAESAGEIPREFFDTGGATLLRRLSARAPRSAGGGAARRPAGGAAGFGQALGGLRAGAQNLLNYVTYYQMKERAGLVGTRGLAPLLGQARARSEDLRIHLIGHSFGARLVAAAASAAPAAGVDSLTLLQAAFSHHAFTKFYEGEKHGAFCSVWEEGKVRGPVLITHTPNDIAVGLAYAIASRIMNQKAASVGDRDDPFGGIGRNGAVLPKGSKKAKVPAEPRKLLPVGGIYGFQGSKLYNLSADDFISDHSDVTDEEVAHAVLAAVGST